MKSSDAKCRLKFLIKKKVLIKFAFFSGSYIYGTSFHFNDSENNLFIGIKVKLLKLHMA